MTRNRIIIDVTADLIRECLGVPENISVVGIFQDRNAFDSNTISIMLEGDGLPEVAEGQMVTRGLLSDYIPAEVIEKKVEIAKKRYNKEEFANIIRKIGGGK